MKTTISALLLSMFAFLSVLIQQREITGLESRLHQQVLTSGKTVERLADQARIIDGLSAASISTMKMLSSQAEDEGVLIQRIHERDRDIFSQDRRIRDLSAELEDLKSKTSPAPIGITPGQGTVRPPLIMWKPATPEEADSVPPPDCWLYAWWLGNSIKSICGKRPQPSPSPIPQRIK